MSVIKDAHQILDMMLFVAVIENKSFTAAAESLGISKSVVSKRITRLEKSLGAQLLHRSTRQLTLSDIGQTFYERCASIRDDIEVARHRVASHYNKPCGTLRVNSPISFAHSHLGPAIADFLSLNPEVKVDMLPGDYYEGLLEHSLDLAIRVGELADSALHARKIMMSPMRLCASPNYVKRYGAPEQLEDLDFHNCLLYHNSPTRQSWHFKRNEQLIDIRVTGNFVSSSSEALVSAAIADLGLVYLPKYVLSSYLKANRLVSVLEDYCQSTINIYAVYPPTRHLAPKVRMFIDFLVDRFLT